MNIKRITKDAGRSTQYEIRNGSAIILAIVLTTLLAMISVLFLLSSRVDSVATSAIGGNEDLKLGVDSVIAQISEVLTRGVPGVDANGTYYDYPDPCSNIDSWLACLEPYQYAPNTYHWRHITDLYNEFPVPMFSRDIQADIIPEYQPTVGSGLPADADGDGVSDSIWVQVPGKVSSKGKPIYAAVRIIDNGGMLNINTGDKFDPSSSVGTSQSDINLMALAHRLNNPYNPAAENILLLTRNPSGLANYEDNVIWQYGLPNGAYTPFDISDELELRYRYLINQTSVDTRSEVMANWQIGRAFDFRTPIDTNARFDEWKITASADGIFADPNQYAYRHIATTYNCDRIIKPNGQKMFNINSPSNFDKNSIYTAVREALDSNVFSNIDVARITANLMDYIDGPDYSPSDPRYDPNDEVTGVPDPNTGTLYYGFERPCIYISEVAENFYQPPTPPQGTQPPAVHSYAIELYKPYWEDDEPNGWYIKTQDLDSDGNPLPYNTTAIIWTGSRRFHILAHIDTTVPEANIPMDFTDIPGPNDFSGFDPNKFNHQSQPADINFAGNTYIYLYRDVNGYPLLVDAFHVPESDVSGSGWMEPKTAGFISQSFERDITLNKCIRKILNPNMTTSPTIGYMNHPFNSGGDMIQAHPANKTFTNIGEIGQLFRTDAYLTGISLPNDEASVRLNLAEPNFQNLFNYLTVMDPNELRYGGHLNNEMRIKGRININTAPWFVLAQLPWVSYHTPNYELARSIVDYRDTIHGAFKNIGELMTDANSSINSIGYYEGEIMPVPTTLLTPTDGVGDKFEERDVIFDRISNLITVRSDVFTAYILVRLGTDGPQKRVIAILDRSGVTPTGGKVKVIAIQPVPEPR